MRTNNGVEIIKNEFKAYLSMHVIQHQKTIPYTSQQNGVSERNNRTLIEMSRCMLYAKGLHKRFWDGTIYHGNYKFDRVPIEVVL